MKKSKAFTLIELLVVIAIIAILAAILFPVFAQAKAAAKKAVCLSQLDEVGMAWQMYDNDYDDEMVPGFGYGQYVKGSYTAGGTFCDYTWYNSTCSTVPGFKVISDTVQKALMYPYVKNAQILQRSCPADNLHYLIGQGTGGFRSTYGLNLNVVNCADFSTLGWRIFSDNLYSVGCSMNKVQEPADTLFMSEAAYVPFGPERAGAADTVTAAGFMYFDSGATLHCYGVHAGITNLAWLDGHAKGMHTNPLNYNISFFSSNQNAYATQVGAANYVGDVLKAPCPQPTVWGAYAPQDAACSYYYNLDKTGLSY